jgi:ribosomal protein S18 acetylase RimI-like enzyme
VIVREAAADDDEAIVALWEASGLTRPWNPPARDIGFLRRSGHGTLLVAEDAGRIVGSVMVVHDGHRGWIYYLAVANERRKGGLGRRLVAEGEAWCRARGAPKVQLMIRPDNAAVRDFYARVGYKEEPIVMMTKWLV